MRTTRRRARKRHRRQPTRLVTERLESRELLAGDVRAIVSGGTLHIRGDAQANEISVAVNDDGDLLVSGQADTTINGGTGPFTVLSGSSTLSRNAVIRMRGGDDVVSLNGFMTANALVANMGHGNDVLEINGVTALGATRIALGSGDDLATLTDTTTTGKVRMSGHRGADTVVVGDVMVMGPTRVALGGSADRLLVSGAAQFDQRLVVVAGRGADFVAFDPAGAGDTAELDNVFLSMGKGTDTVVLDSQTTTTGRVVVRGGRGVDLFDNESPVTDVRSFSTTLGTATNADSIIDEIFADMTAAGIDVSDFQDDGVTDPPTINTSGGSTPYTEGDDPVTIDAGITVRDDDSTNIASATVTINPAELNIDDLLAVTTVSGVTSSFSVGVLTLTGDATVAEYEQMLRSVTFVNSGDNVDPASRTITFQVQDPDENTASATRTMDITAVNDQPSITASGATANFIEGGSPVTVDGTLTVADADQLLTEATITITNGFGAGDVLDVTEQAGVIATVDDGGRILLLTGDATPAVYQQILRSLTFFSSSDNPGVTRTIDIQVGDGDLTATAAFTVEVTEVSDPAQLELPANLPVPLTVDVNTLLEFTVTSNGDASSVLQLDLDNSGIDPAGAQPTIDTAGQFRWTPSTTGQFEIRIILVNSDGTADQESIIVNVV